MASCPLKEIIAVARQASATDVQIRPLGTRSAELWLRIDGKRQRSPDLSQATYVRIVALAKAKAGLPGYITDRPQDGCLPANETGDIDDIRVAFLPTIHGETMSLRLAAHHTLPAPDKLGLPPGVLLLLQSTMRETDGLILVCGLTGAGKTTTVQCLLHETIAHQPHRHVVTIEDPVERYLPGVTQISVGRQESWSQSDAFKAVLRHDPDIIALGELRDQNDARMALHAALSGHLVIASLHCARAGDAYRRLKEMGMNDAHLFPALRAVVAQRLIRCGASVVLQAEGNDWRRKPEPALPFEVTHTGDDLSEIIQSEVKE
jgi:general secretion pathway protein E